MRNYKLHVAGGLSRTTVGDHADPWRLTIIARGDLMTAAEPRPSRVALTRLPEKASDDRAALDALLDDVMVGHVGLARPDGSPVVLPTAIARDGDRVLIHGSTGSPWIRAVADGAAICLAVTAMDGIVVARSAFESSIHYRSAVLFGRCVQLHGDEKRA